MVRRRAANEIVMRGADNGSAGRDVTFDLDATAEERFDPVTTKRLFSGLHHQNRQMCRSRNCGRVRRCRCWWRPSYLCGSVRCFVGDGGAVVDEHIRGVGGLRIVVSGTRCR